MRVWWVSYIKVTPSTCMLFPAMAGPTQALCSFAYTTQWHEPATNHYAIVLVRDRDKRGAE